MFCLMDWVIMMNQKEIIQVMYQENLGRQHPFHNACQRLLANERTIFPSKRKPTQSHHPPTRTGSQAKNRGP